MLFYEFIHEIDDGHVGLLRRSVIGITGLGRLIHQRGQHLHLEGGWERLALQTRQIAANRICQLAHQVELCLAVRLYARGHCEMSGFDLFVEPG